MAEDASICCPPCRVREHTTLLCRRPVATGLVQRRPWRGRMRPDTPWQDPAPHRAHRCANIEREPNSPETARDPAPPHHSPGPTLSGRSRRKRKRVRRGPIWVGLGHLRAYLRGANTTLYGVLLVLFWPFLHCPEADNPELSTALQAYTWAPAGRHNTCHTVQAARRMSETLRSSQLGRNMLYLPSDPTLAPTCCLKQSLQPSSQTRAIRVRPN